jgi:hypothetical protein
MTGVPLLIVALFVLLIVYSIIRAWRKHRAETKGRIALATVVSVSGTGFYEGKQPVMNINLDVEQPDGTRQRGTARTTIAPGVAMNPGSRVAVVVDPKDPARVFLADSSALNRNDDAAAAIRLAQSVPPEFSGKLAVGDVRAITPAAGGTSSVQIDVVNLGHPRQTVFCLQRFPSTTPFALGDRVYLKLDSLSPPQAGYILPPSFTKGDPIPSSGNRVDALVLADELLFAGAKAQGTVSAAEQMPLPDAYRRSGASKWTLRMSVIPEDGSARYDGTMSIAVSSPAKAATISGVGATLPLRYDPSDPPSFTLDSIALGWGDPKLARAQAEKISAQIHRRN